MKRFPVLTPLAAALALTVCGAMVHAATPVATSEQELEAAQADLQRAARRVAELSGAAGNHQDMVIERRTLRGPVLGVVLEPDARAGVRVAAVTPGSAAASAGLRIGDRLTSVDGKAVNGADGEARLADLRARLRNLDVKTPVTLGYERDGRAATVKATPRQGEHLVVVHDADGQQITLHGEPTVAIDSEGQTTMSSRMIRVAPAGVDPQIHREIVRIDRNAPCRDADCRFSLLEDAFRWNGLNLASVDSRLGRYFGTDRGVLVLSMPEGMGGLQPGDVILKLDGKQVDTPREAMAAAHSSKPGTPVPVEYLRDRRRATAKVTMPERRMLQLPPAPPAPPAPPTPPAHAAPHAMLPPPRPAAPAVPPAPPVPPAAAPVAPPPPPAAPEPPDSPTPG